MNKYLFMIILGILIYYLINNKDGFSVGCIGWAILKNAEDVVPRLLPEIGSQNLDDYYFYYNPLFSRDDIISTFPSARNIIIFDNINETEGLTEPISYATTSDDPINFGTIDFQYYLGHRYANSDYEILFSRMDAGYQGNDECAATVTTLAKTVIDIWRRILNARRSSSGWETQDDFDDNILPFERAITYTLQNNTVPLFYTASRFYYSIIHLLRNGNINNLTINQTPEGANIGNSTVWFGGNSSIGSSVMSVSTCLCDYASGESATSYYFNRYLLTSPNERETKEEIISYMLNGYQGGEPPIPETAITPEHLEIIMASSRHDLLSRVMIILKPRDTTNMNDLFERTVRITWAYGDFPRKTTSQNVIQLNQDLTNPKGWWGSTQARLLYTYEGWEAIVFLSDRQREIIDKYT
jgi:hypothetical protein